MLLRGRARPASHGTTPPRGSGCAGPHQPVGKIIPQRNLERRAERPEPPRQSPASAGPTPRHRPVAPRAAACRIIKHRPRAVRANRKPAARNQRPSVQALRRNAARSRSAGARASRSIGGRATAEAFVKQFCRPSIPAAAAAPRSTPSFLKSLSRSMTRNSMSTSGRSAIFAKPRQPGAKARHGMTTIGRAALGARARGAQGLFENGQPLAHLGVQALAVLGERFALAAEEQAQPLLNRGCGGLPRRGSAPALGGARIGVQPARGLKARRVCKEGIWARRLLPRM